MVTDKFKSYAAANWKMGLKLGPRQHKGLNNRAENSHQLTLGRENVMRRYKSSGQLQRVLSVHDQVVNQFMRGRYNCDSKVKRELRNQALTAWNVVTCGTVMCA